MTGCLARSRVGGSPVGHRFKNTSVAIYVVTEGIARSSSRGNDPVQPSSVRGRRPPGLWNRNKSLSSLLALHEASVRRDDRSVCRSIRVVVGGGEGEVGNRLPLSLALALGHESKTEMVLVRSLGAETVVVTSRARWTQPIPPDRSSPNRSRPSLALDWRMSRLLLLQLPVPLLPFRSKPTCTGDQMTSLASDLYDL